MLNKFKLQEQILQAIEYEDKPIYISDLHRKFNLPFITMHSKRNNPTGRQAIIDLADQGKILILRSTRSPMFSTMPHLQLCLPDCKRIPPFLRVVNHLYTGNVPKDVQQYWPTPKGVGEGWGPKKKKGRPAKQTKKPGFFSRLRYLFFPND